MAIHYWPSPLGVNMGLPGHNTWPAQFEQFLTVGAPLATPRLRVVEVQGSAGWPGGTKLTFVLEQNTPREHTIGRFRLSATTATLPPRPRTTLPPHRLVSGKIRACPNSGTLVIATELSLNGRSFVVGDAQARLSGEGALGGQDLPCELVVPGPGDSAPWQAWRIALQPCPGPQLFELRITARNPAGVTPPSTATLSLTSDSVQTQDQIAIAFGCNDRQTIPAFETETWRITPDEMGRIAEIPYQGEGRFSTVALSKNQLCNALSPCRI